ncbi:MAG TPA: YfhO family protein, partial [Anaerovoracaceae bacterium]|nr:YfhO family protein [Anaerovoracaceae bacterium]
VLLAGLLYKKRNERVLAFGMVLITVFPIFLYVLNGGLYINDKALIPFLPVVCYLIALFFQKLEADEGRFRKNLLFLFVGTVVLTLFSMDQTIYWILAFADALLMVFCYLIYQISNKIKFIVIPVILILFITDIVIQNPDKLVDEVTYREIFNPDINKVTRELSDADPSFYRMDSLLNKDANLNRIYNGNQYLTSFYSSSYQKDYLDFRNEIFQLEQPYRNYLMQPASQNPLFLSFMGVKYVRSDYAPVGYELFMKKGNVNIYRNQNVFPLGYATNKLISEKEFAKSEFPYRQELLMNRAVVKLQPASKYQSNLEQEEAFQTKISPITLSLPQSEGNDFTLSLDHGVYRVKAQSDTYRYISLPNPAGEDQVMFLEMKVKNLTPLQDISIKIQNEQNKLSADDHVYYNNNTVFHYAVSVKKGCQSLSVKFSSGEYELLSLQSYTLNAADMINKNITACPFEVSEMNTKGDVIAGSVNAKEDGYFITSIPYDKNFKITMDGKNISCEEVNMAFIGFPIAKGLHHIIFHYESPGFLPGAASSIIGFLIFGFIIYTDRKKGNRGDYYGE